MKYLIEGDPRRIAADPEASALVRDHIRNDFQSFYRKLGVPPNDASMAARVITASPTEQGVASAMQKARDILGDEAAIMTTLQRGALARAKARQQNPNKRKLLFTK